TVTQYFTFTYPYFDTYLTIYCLSEVRCIIDIHTESVQWSTALFELFRTCNFRTIQTTTYFYFDTLGTHAHCCRDSHFNSPLVANAALQLASDSFSNYLRIQFRTTNLHNVDLYVFFAGK